MPRDLRPRCYFCDRAAGTDSCVYRCIHCVANEFLLGGLYLRLIDDLTQVRCCSICFDAFTLHASDPTIRQPLSLFHCRCCGHADGWRKVGA